MVSVTETGFADETPTLRKIIRLAFRDSLFVAVFLALVALAFHGLGQLTATVNVEETVTGLLTWLALSLLPYGLFIAANLRLRELRTSQTVIVTIVALVLSVGIQSVLLGIDYSNATGAFGTQNSLQFTVQDTPDGVEVQALVPGGTAEEAGLQVGDLLMQIRRDDIDVAAIQTAMIQGEPGDILRFRFVRDGEEMALPVTIVEETGVDNQSILLGYAIAVVVALATLYMPGGWIPYALLIGFLFPLLIGYTWIMVATFSVRTEGILPMTADGQVGGWTLNNWSFLVDGKVGRAQQLDIWVVTTNSFMIAVVMTISVLLVASMAGYALSRMKFPGRKGFLGLTLILHSFPAVTLLIPIFIVLQNIGKIPVIGDLYGYNTIGGVALVMVAFELPLGVFLMKGFFDNISWDMERSAMIDGATRWRTFFEIVLPQIRPGLLALGIFTFLSGWNAYLIPATYLLGGRTANLPVLINSLTGEVQPTNWNEVAAIGMFQLIPILLLFIFAQEYLLNIYAGGSKGGS